MQLVVHLQLINTCMTLAARGRAVQDGTQPISELTQPQRLGFDDDGLAPHISSLVCPSFNVLYQGCFRRRKIHVLESARRLSEYLLARLVDIRQSTEYNEMTKLSMTAMPSEGVSG